MTAPAAAPVTTRSPLPAMLLAALLSLIAGSVVLAIVNGGIVLLWETIPDSFGQAPAWYVLAVVLAGAVLVYVVRRFVGDTGHSPIGGITVSALSPKEYVGAILAIIASLWAGAVLGPEVALVATGSVLGGLVCRWRRVGDAAGQKKVIGFAALGGLLALVVGPALSGSLAIGAPDAIEVDQFGWAVVVALIASVVITVARLVGALLARATGGRPHLVILLIAGAVIGVSALIVQARTGLAPIFITTSGEELLSDLPGLTSISAVLSIVVFKGLAYAVSLGSGFRGGPYLPGMFIGGSVGLAAALLMPSGPSVSAGMVVGVVAAVIATAPMSWKVAILLGVVLGFLMGSWPMIPAAVIAAVVARAVPRWGDRIALPHA